MKTDKIFLWLAVISLLINLYLAYLAYLERKEKKEAVKTLKDYASTN